MILAPKAQIANNLLRYFFVETSMVWCAADALLPTEIASSILKYY
jgi:hypothetical protein